MFSFKRLPHIDPQYSVDMMSTGEVCCVYVCCVCVCVCGSVVKCKCMSVYG
jgi:hypothetical protein